MVGFGARNVYYFVDVTGCPVEGHFTTPKAINVSASDQITEAMLNLNFLPTVSVSVMGV